MRRRSLAGLSIGVALVVAPFAAANIVDFGNLAGPHVAANLAPLTDSWAASRLQRAALWFLPDQAFGIIGLGALALIIVSNRLGLELRRAQLIALFVAAAMAASASVGAFARDSLWHAWPAAFLLLVPTSRAAGLSSLWALIVFPIAGIWLSSTHDGGAQWGPRFVLICTPALVLMAAASCADASGDGYARRTRQALIVIVLLAGIWTTRAAYRELRGTKKIYAQMVDTVETHVRPGSYVVTNLWWFDQVAASLYGTRTFLFAEDAAASTHVLQQLATAGVPNVTLVWSRDLSEGEPLASAVIGTCYRFITVKTMPERALSVGTATCH